jgi:hypothetical protein
LIRTLICNHDIEFAIVIHITRSKGAGVVPREKGVQSPKRSVTPATHDRKGVGKNFSIRASLQEEKVGIPIIVYVNCSHGDGGKATGQSKQVHSFSTEAASAAPKKNADATLR